MATATTTRHQPRRRATTGAPTPIAVDLGGGETRVWTPAHGIHTAVTADTSAAPLLRRGRIVNAAGCASLLAGLAPMPPSRPRRVVVACRPVLAAVEDQETIRQVVTAAFGPARVHLIDTVRAAAIGAGAAAWVLLIVDIGAQLTETALLVDGRVAAARRTSCGIAGLAAATSSRLLISHITAHVTQLRRDPPTRALADTALSRGILAVGRGATPELTSQLAAVLRAPVRAAAAGREVAISGAAVAAAALCRHPGNWP
jgi:rod shape-determining protein MreB